MRYIPLALALFATPLLPSISLAADAPPNFTGSWQLDTAKSQVDSGQNIKFDIQDDSTKITLVRHVHEQDGREVISRFSCTENGAQCDFDEGGHKAKVSVWHDGPSLFVLKTNGRKEDSTAEWQMQLSPDTKTLNVQFTLLSPTEKTEKRVFTKGS